MNLPSFLIIGAAKCGTTSLFRYLSLHPKIFLSPIKEPCFFSYDETYEKGIEWYSRLFDEAKPNQICGEASTTYTQERYTEKAAKRIHDHLPNVKLIYLMRNPIDRLYSNYKQYLKEQQANDLMHGVDISFENYLAKEGRFALETGNYQRQIQKYLKYFDKESMLLLLFEDFIQNPQETLERVCEFLGIEKITFPESIEANQTEFHEQWILRRRIMAPFYKIPGFRLLADNILKGIKDSLYQLIRWSNYGRRVKKKVVAPKAMQKKLRSELIEKYRTPNGNLEGVIKRDLGYWNR